MSSFYESILSHSQLGTRVRDALELALVQARRAPQHFRHGAVLFRGKEVYGLGTNQMRPAGWVRKNCWHPTKKGDAELSTWTMHAEIACLHGVARDTIAGKNVAVVRINRNGQLVNSRPCRLCQVELHRRGVHRIYFSLDDDTFGRMDLN